MSKTLVNIITENSPIPAYLFIKEKYQPGDKIMYISAKDTSNDLKWLSVIDGVSANNIEEIVLKNDIDEFKYEKICRAVKFHLKKNVHYCVNLAGGTRYMALAVQQVFESFDSEFFYVNIEDNTIIKSKFDNNIYDDDDIIYPIKYRMRLPEYLTAHELEHDALAPGHTPTLPYPVVENMFQLFSQNLLSGNDYTTMETLRLFYRNKKKKTPISELEHPNKPNIHPIPNIRSFLRMVSIPISQDELNHSQIEWLTGGWFEEFVYYKVKEKIQPDDISIGIRIAQKGIKRKNELDVMFIKNNQLFVIECKTGVETERMFNEIVYKACALKEALLGVSCCSYIASLKRDETDDLKKIADNMDITFWDNTIMTTHLDEALENLNKRL